MAPKRSSPPPPPPLPAYCSSEETASGSGSEEEEEEIAHSPPPAAPKSIAPPPLNPRAAAAMAPKRSSPPPPPRRPAYCSSEASSGSESEQETSDEEAAAAAAMAPKRSAPPPPPPKAAPNQEMEAKGAKQLSAPFQRTWSTDDEFRILEALAAHRLEHGTLPQTDVLANALAGKLDNSGCSLSELKRKVESLHRLFDLFKNVWPSVTKAPTKAAANSGAGREPDEMCELYPYLAEEVKALQKAHPGMFKREFTMIDDSKARALDEKIKRQRHAQMKLHLEVTKTLMDLAG